MSLDLDAIEERARNATTGPWWQSGPPWFNTGMLVLAFSEDPHAGAFVADCELEIGDLDGQDDKISDAQRTATAEFIAHARTDIPQLVAELWAARAERDMQGRIIQDLKISESHAKVLNVEQEIELRTARRVYAELGSLVEPLRAMHSRTPGDAGHSCGWCRLISAYDQAVGTQDPGRERAGLACEGEGASDPAMTSRPGSPPATEGGA